MISSIPGFDTEIKIKERDLSNAALKPGGVQLYCGDCMDILPHLSGIDAVITDPPYGMNWNTDTTRFSGGKQIIKRGRDWKNPIHGDDTPFDPSPWLKFKRVILWGSNHFAQKLDLGTTLVFVKRNDAAFGSFLSDAEIAWMKGGYGVYCFRDVPGFSDKGLHPTQKTIPLMWWCIEKCKTPYGATVLDPYMGSGTTGIACIRSGRRFIGIEKDPEHFKIAKERIELELMNPRNVRPAELLQ